MITKDMTIIFYLNSLVGMILFFCGRLNGFKVSFGS